MKNLLNLALISSTILLASIPHVALAKSVEQDVKDTGVLKVAVRQDSPLFGFGDDYNGYCADFAKQLGAKLTQDFGKNIQVKLVTSTTQTRWDLVTKGQAHLECGPNTTSKERETKYKIFFSTPFFVTATQMFTKEGLEDQALKAGTIGVIANTSNEEELKTVYPGQQLNNSYTNRTHGIADVLYGSITAFASDGILLMGTAITMDVDLSNYTLVTPLVNNRPFCAGYGMILPGGEENKNWRETVNSFILTNGQGTEVWNNWFGDSLPYIDEVLKACQVN